MIFSWPKSGEWQRLAVVLVACAVSARFGLWLHAVSGFAAMVWPFAGVALFTLLRFGRYPHVLAIFLGALVAFLHAGVNTSASVGLAAAQMLGALASSKFLHHLEFNHGLVRVRDVVMLLIAVIVGSTIQTILSLLAALPTGAFDPQQLADCTIALWLGHVLGALIVAPVLLISTRQSRRPVRRFQHVEGLLLLLALGGWSFVVFGELLQDASKNPLGRSYMLFPVLVWAALRFTQEGATTSMLTLSAIATTATFLNAGPFVRGTLIHGLIALQCFMGVAAAVLLVLAAAIEERDLLYEEAREAIKARDDFLSIASHELKTPLTSLGLQVASLHHAMDRGEPLSGRRFSGKLNTITRQVDRLTVLINSLLDVSRVMRGRLKLDIGDVDFSTTVRDVIARFNDQLIKSDVKLVLAIEDSCTGHWDRSRLEQIVTHLLSNALKYGAAEPVEVRLEATAAQAILTVNDHGIGISSHDQSRIFERFERAASLDHFAGLGLGLWMVKQIVNAMGGTVDVKSKLGAGAEFKVILPRNYIVFTKTRQGHGSAEISTH